MDNVLRIIFESSIPNVIHMQSPADYYCKEEPTYYTDISTKIIVACGWIAVSAHSLMVTASWLSIAWLRACLILSVDMLLIANVVIIARVHQLDAWFKGN